MFFFFSADRLKKKRINVGRKPEKIMSVSEVTTFGIQKQQLNQRAESVEANVFPEPDVALQISEGDIVTLNFASEESLSKPYSAAQFKYGETVQEISSTAQAASTFSQAIEGDLNEDELAAIQKLATQVEPIAKEFLSSDREKFNVEKTVDIALPDIVSVQTEAPDFDVENIRQLPTLVSAVIDAGFEKQFQALNKTNREFIISSLSELMQFFREKVVQVLEPLRHPPSLTESGVQIPVEVDLKTQPEKEVKEHS